MFVGGLPRGDAILRKDVGEFVMGIEGICCHPNVEEQHGTFFSSMNHSGISCLMLCVLYQYVKHFFQKSLLKEPCVTCIKILSA